MGSVKGISSVQHFVCKRKEHGDSRAPLSDLKKELENCIGKLGTTIVDSKIQFAVNFMFQNAIRAGSESFCESIHGAFDSETGVQVSCQNKNVCSESSENSIYLMQNLRTGNSDCITFFDSGVNLTLLTESWQRRRNYN